MLRRLRQGLPVAIVAAALCGAVVHATPPAPTVPVVEMHGVLLDSDAGRLSSALEGAASGGAPCVIIDIDSPGGTPDAVRQIIDAEVAAQVPVITYVGPGAHARGGALLVAEGGWVINVAATGVIGSDHPLSSTPLTTTMAHGTATDVLATLARSHGRATAALVAIGDHGGSLGGGVALRDGAIDLDTAALDALLRALDGHHVPANATAVLHTAGLSTLIIAADGWDAMVRNLAFPDAAYALLVIAVLCVGMFIAHPGAFVLGLIGVSSAIGAAVGFSSLPINPLGLALIGLSFVLFMVDLRAATHGGLTAAAAVAMALGGWQLVRTGMLDTGVSSVLVVITVVTITGAYAALVPKLLEARRMPFSDPHTDLIGRVATVREPLRPDGYVMLDGTLWRAIATRSPLPERARVRVVDVTGLRLTVEPETTTGTDRG